jgi:DNA processing protein
MHQFTQDDDQLAALALWRCPGVGPVNFRRVLAQLDQPAQFLDPACTATLVEKLPAQARAVLQAPKQRAQLIAAAEGDFTWGQQQGRCIVFEGAAAYPASLLPYADATPILFVLGEPELLHLPQIAIVGTRNPSRSGKENACEFARALAEQGFVITSGMARGIDGCAHDGALQASEGKTLGVLAHGLDRFYPRENASLARRVLAAGGALVSEFPLGVSPQRQYFPRRNRIMSGLSLGVLVVEAAIKSGSLITAGMALQQGKDVFALPGSIQNPQSRGCHKLIREGATLVETVRDVFTVLAPQMQQELQANAAEALSSESPLDEAEQVPSALDLLNPAERQLYEALDDMPSSIDELVMRTNRPAEQLLTQLMLLELKALVQTVPGGYRRQAVA